MAKQTINTANAYYNYTSPTSIYNGVSSSNTLPVYILDAGVTFSKTTDKSYGAVGDTIKYTLEIKNTSSSPLYNIVVTDTLPTNMSFSLGSLTYNGITFGSENITLGVTIPDLQVNQVTTIAFNGVITGDSIKTLTNVAKINYETTIGTTTIPIIMDSNAAYISVFNKNISFTKLQSKSQLALNDVGTYSFMINNFGNIPISNIFVVDTVPTGLVFNPGTLMVNGVATTGNPNTGVFFNSLNPNEGILISYQFTVVEAANGGIIKNIGQLSYNYKDNQGLTLVDTVPSNETILTISVVDAVAFQLTDKKDYRVGDTVVYTLTIDNIGTVAMEDIIAITTLPITSLSYIPNSLVINGVSVPDQNIITGISIPELLSKNVTTVNFSLKILNDSIKEISNLFTILYNVGITITGYSLVPGYNYQTTSNPWTFYILNPNLQMSKTSSSEYIEKGDTVIYTIILKNTGSDILQGVKFIDTIPNDFSFVSGEMIIGNTTFAIGNPSLGINIETIDVNQVITINIQAKS